MNKLLSSWSVAVLFASTVFIQGPAAISDEAEKSCCSSVLFLKDGKLDESKYSRDEDADPARVESARRIIAGLQDFMARADAQHKRIEEELKLADELRGEAGSTSLSGGASSSTLKGSASTAALQGSASTSIRQGAATKSITPVKLSGQALVQAQNQYNSDLKDFALHANEYEALLKKFNAEMGECKASEAAYQAQVQDFTLHTGQFHLQASGRKPQVIIVPDGIKPPHVCGVLFLTKNQADDYYARLKNDEQKVTAVGGQQFRNAAEAEYATADNRLARAQVDNDHQTKRAIKEAEREQREAELVGAFAKLREEHKTLSTENDFLKSSGKSGAAAAAGSTHGGSNTSVKGAVKK